ncbi:tetraspanin-33 [Plutella xylostella]|uniref:tetraspanin-33 n=1 Tax=Plutella xylostella TaxID=51655 RepID=UPI0020326542|nr:tetraspanin-33 [Plutella xylostella]
MSTTNSAKMKSMKSETEHNMKSIKFLLLTITTMFLIISGLMIVLGISVYSHYHSLSFLYESAKSGNFFTPSILVVVMGMVMMIVTLFGFFGSLKESTCMVNLYAYILFLVFLVELIVVCVAFRTDPASLARHVDIPVHAYSSDSEISDEIDRMQYALSCCGSDSYLDYVGQEFTANHSTAAATVTTTDTVTLLLPKSCCESVIDETCSSVKLNGCKRAIINVLVQNSSVLGVLGVSVMFIQVLGITFALLLAHCIRKMKSERALQTWKMCEERIMARKLEEKKDIPTITIGHIDSSKA